MSKWKKRLLIVLAVLVLIVASLFIFLHDDADLDAIEKEQVESIDESKNEMHNDLENSFEQDSIE